MPAPIDFLAIGDFTGTGRRDVLAGARSGGLYLLEGTVEGSLVASELSMFTGGYPPWRRNSLEIRKEKQQP